eukprot:6775307-Heterocapsa_arctica.AAC.1
MARKPTRQPVGPSHEPQSVTDKRVLARGAPDSRAGRSRPSCGAPYSAAGVSSCNKYKYASAETRLQQ